MLLFWLQLLALLVVARGLGALMRRIGQPAVVGELTAGLVLGPSVLGRLAPAAHAWLFPADPVQWSLLGAVGWLGVFFLLVLTGFETDLTLIRRLGRAAVAVAVGSLALPFLFGLGVGFSMPAEFIGPRARVGVFALFMASALSISSLPVIAKILSELDLMRRNFGQITLAAGMANDVMGWVLLGVIAGLAQSGSLELGRLAITLGGLALFLLAALTVGQRIVDTLLRRARRQRAGMAELLTLTLALALAIGVLTQALGVEAVLGAFVAGILLGRSRFQEPEIVSQLENATLSLFAPVFFATAGLRMDLSLLADPTTVLWAGIVLAAASVSKFAGAYAGARVAGLLPREGIALGAGLNARGALEVVIATVGLALGVLNPDSYTVIVLMAIATSMAAPPMLRAVVRNWPGSAEEAARLERERALSSNVLVRPARLLLPSHGGPNSLLAARLLDLAWPEGVEATILSAGPDVPKSDVERVLGAFAARPVEHESIVSQDPLRAILDHAVLGYGAIGVGATDTRVGGQLVSPLVDALLAGSPIPVIVVRRGAEVVPEQGARFRRILVPAIGTRIGRAALEVAASVAQRCGAELLLVHVVTVPRSDDTVGGYRRLLQRVLRGEPEPESGQVDAARGVLDEACELARGLGVDPRPLIRTGTAVPEELLALARAEAVDLVVLPANLRQLSGRPFLGHGVEQLLERSESTVVIVTLPAGGASA